MNKEMTDPFPEPRIATIRSLAFPQSVIRANYSRNVSAQVKGLFAFIEQCLSNSQSSVYTRSYCSRQIHRNGINDIRLILESTNLNNGMGLVLNE